MTYRPTIHIRRGYTSKDHLLDEIAGVARAALQLGPGEFPSEQRAVIAAERSIIYVVGSREEYRGCSAGLLGGAEEVR